MSDALVALLAEARILERAQATFYRSLAAVAVRADAHDVMERVQALHADEQHHLARLTARLIELGGDPSNDATPPEIPALVDWEVVARQREADEVQWYRSALERGILDDATRGLFLEILDSEQHHERELGGKWMSA